MRAETRELMENASVSREMREIWQVCISPRYKYGLISMTMQYTTVDIIYNNPFRFASH